MFTLHNPIKLNDLSGYFVTSHACPMCDTKVTVTIAPEKLYAYNQGAYAQINEKLTQASGTKKIWMIFRAGYSKEPVRSFRLSTEEIILN